MPNVLIVDDEENVLYSFSKALSGGAVEVLTAGDGAEAIASVRRQKIDAVVLDVRLPDMSGLDVFDHLRRVDPSLPVIFVTAHATTETAIDAMKRGAFEYLVKPVDVHQLQALVIKAVELSQLQRASALLGEGSTAEGAPELIVGRSEAMQRVYKSIGRVAPEDVTVLIRGESGVGKELVAKAIFCHSSRSERPFLAINCAALTETLLESELFGHERGAFTGAERQRLGAFERAHGGTLFLDELGDMSHATQAKVLRVLQDGCFERVGGAETIHSDLRIIAATNQQLEEKILAGEFRTDLLYRLNGFSITLPPLRDRLEDLPLLIDHFLRASNKELNSQATRFSPDALEVLSCHDWPGNVRELQSAVRYAVVHCVGEVITPEFLPDSCRSAPPAEGAAREDLTLKDFVCQQIDQGGVDVYRRLIGDFDAVVVEEAMRRVGGNQLQASERLGISRTTLRAKLDRLDLAARDAEREKAN